MAFGKRLVTHLAVLLPLAAAPTLADESAEAAVAAPEQSLFFTAPCNLPCTPGFEAEPGGDILLEIQRTEDENVVAYCLSYLGNRTCDVAQMKWSPARWARMYYPCGTHEAGFVIELDRTARPDESTPSIWFAYSNGATAVSEGETAAEVLPLFVCESPTE